MRKWRRLAAMFKGHDEGTVAITFMLSLPIYLVVIGIIVQYSLLVNARMTVDRACAAAARTAVTAFPTDPKLDPMDGVAFVQKSARMTLAPISPKATDGITPEAQAVNQALLNLNAPIVTTYAERYSFAQASTSISWTRVDANNQPIGEPEWQPAQFAQHAGQRIQITVVYSFLMNVPLVQMFTGHSDTIAGVSGRYSTFTSTIIVQLAPGRETATDDSGWPQ